MKSVTRHELAGVIEPDGPTLLGSDVDVIRQYSYDVVLRAAKGLGEHNALLVVYDLEPGQLRSYFLATIDGLGL